MPSVPNPKFDKAVADFTNILIDNELIVEDFLFKEKKCKCIRVYYKRKIFYIIKTCDFTTADVLEDHQNWLDYLECIKKEMCCYIREKTECVPICIKQTLLKSFQSVDGEVTYILRVDVKNESDKKIKNLVVRDLLLKKDMCVGLIEVLIDHGCSVKPVDEDTPEQYVGNGYLLDPRFSCLEPHADVAIVYTVQLIDQTTSIHNMTSRIEVYGRLVSRVGSEIILEPIARAGEVSPASELRDLGSRTLTLSNIINYFIPSNCIALRSDKFGVNNATISRTINGISYTIKLTNWVKKAGTTNQYIKVDYELLPTDKGVVNKITAIALTSLYNVTPNNTSGTFSVPLNTVIAKSLTRQTTFLLILFCITPCTMPTISLQPIGSTVSAGTPITVNATVTGIPTPTVTYTLNSLNVNLSGNQLDTTDLSGGLYNLVATATNSCGTATSNTVSFTICAPPTVTINSVTPQPLNYNIDSVLIINYTSTGSNPTINYTIFDISSVIQQSGSLGVSPVSLDVSSLSIGTYNLQLTASNACGISSSAIQSFDIVCPTPTVSITPQNPIAEAGTSVTFTATSTGLASGDNGSYQWYKNNVIINGNTSSILTLITTLEDSGEYYVTVTNQCGVSVSSNIALLTVQDTTAPNPPNIVSVIDSNSIVVDNNSVVCSASSYMVFVLAEPNSNVTLSDNGNLLGNITADENGQTSFTDIILDSDMIHTLTATATDSSNNISSQGSFSFEIISPISGNVFSTFTVSVMPDSFSYNILLGPFSLNQVQYTLSYDIFNNTTQTAVTSIISIIDPSQLQTGTILNAVTGNSYSARIYASNQCATNVLVGTSDVISICLPPNILTQPQSQIFVDGASLTLSVDATVTNNDIITYQWYENFTGPITGAIGSTLSLTNLSVAENGNQYYVIATSSCGAFTKSSIAEITLQSSPPKPALLLARDITNNINTPYDYHTCFNNSLYAYLFFSLDSIGLAATLYVDNNIIASQLVNEQGAVVFQNIPITGPGLHTVAAEYLDINTGIVGPRSGPYIFTIDTPITGTITTSTTTSNATSNGFSYNIMVASNSIPNSIPYTMLYEISNGTQIIATGDITSGTATGIVTNSTITTYYTTIKATNACGTVTNQAETFTVCLLPIIATQPNSISIVENSGTTLSVVASNASTYQWYRRANTSSQFNITSEPGNTTATINIPPLLLIENNVQYKVRVFSSCGTYVESNTVTIKVLQLRPYPPTITSISKAGGTVYTIRWIPSSSNSYYKNVSYRIYNINGNLMGQTSFINATITLVPGTTYYVRAVDNNGGESSNSNGVIAPQ